jgi:hypothetical protein
MKISKLLSVVGALAFCFSFVAVRAQDNPAQAAAREALMKHMSEVQASETPQTPPPAATVPAAPTAPVEAAPAAPTVDAAAPAATAPIVIVSETNAPATTAPAAVSSTIPAPVPIVAPALPISMTKEARLQALLAKYKADQITPEQYHTQRAAIIAEP